MSPGFLDYNIAMLQEFLSTLLLAFLVALPISYLSARLKLPPLVGFLLSGLLVGPAGFSLVKDPHLIENLAELGVIFLMFLLGVEFSLKKLLAYRKEVLWGGLLQVFFTLGVTSLLSFLFLKKPLPQSLFYGALIAFSSTAVVLKLLMERGELNSPYGRYIFGILIFQDLSVILVMLFLPLLAGEGVSYTLILLTLTKSFGILVGIFLVSFRLVPFLLDMVMKTRSREIFLISLFLIALGTALLSYKLGLSMALGAFLAGIIISESDYAYQVMAEVKPLKDLFMALFFISVGMLLDPKVLLDNPLLSLSSFGLVVLLKVGIIFGVVMFLSKNMRLSLLSSLYLFQIGEFSFVLALEGEKLGLFSSEAFYQLFIGISILTLLATPFVVTSAHRFSEFLLRRILPQKLGLIQKIREREEEHLSGHTVVVGYGICGKNVVYGLKLLKIPYIILELNPANVRIYKKKGEPIYFADATHPEILKKFGLERARALVVAISDHIAVRKIIQVARTLNPHLYIIARTQFVTEIDELLMLGANEVVPEEFEASIELFIRVLEFYKIPQNLLKELTDELRKGHYQALRKEGPLPLVDIPTEEWWRILNFENYLIKEGSPLTGLSIKNLDLRAKTGATILAIQRNKEILLNPSPDILLQKGDILILTGRKEDLRKAMEYLENPISAWY